MLQFFFEFSTLLAYCLQVYPNRQPTFCGLSDDFTRIMETFMLFGAGFFALNCQHVKGSV
jgi:hypothetical protein